VTAIVAALGGFAIGLAVGYMLREGK